MKRTIGLLVNTFYDEYESSIWEGVKKATKEYGYNLICFIGGSLNNPYFNNITRNAVYDLACSKNIDGILVISVSIGSYITRDALQAFLNSFSPIPLVSIGIPFHEIPCVFIANMSGMQALVTHLVEVHNYRRIAFIRGPEQNKDAKARFKAYKNVLSTCNIVFDPDLIIDGSFHVNSGQVAVTHLIDDRKVSFDVIIGANDYVAINAITELQKRGIRVPEDIAVVGFDNVTEGQYLSCPLTTVNQPSFTLGYHAALTIFSLINSRRIEMHKEIGSKLIVRRSCGCDIINDIQKIDQYVLRSTNKKIEKKQFISAITDIMNPGLRDPVSSKKLSGLAEKLFISLQNDLKEKSTLNFLTVFHNVINEVSKETSGSVCWYTVICFIIFKIIPALPLSTNSDFNIDLFTNALRLVDTFTLRNVKQTIIKANEREMHLYSLKKMMHTVLEVHQLKKIIRKEFPILGIRSCYICVNRKKNADVFTSVQLLLAYMNGGCFESENNMGVFDSKLLMPEGIKKCNTGNSFIILSLNYREELLGFVLYESEHQKILSQAMSLTTERSLCEVLTIELGNTIKGIMLFQQVEEQTKYIEKSTDEISGRYNSNVLPEEKLQEYYQQLLLYMDTEKPYIDLDLTLPELAQKLNIPRNHLSYVINKYARVNFYSFINSYRIEEAKLNLEKNAGEKINILDVALNSGFHSKSTFYKVFKRYTQVTPTDYRNNYFLVKENQ